MDEQEVAGHYALLAAAKRGEYPDGRTKLGKSLACFRACLRRPFADSWNSLQDARELLDVPIMLFYLAMPVVNKDGRLLDDFKWAHNALERLIKDISDLADKKPKGKVKTIKQIIQESKEDKK